MTRHIHTLLCLGDSYTIGEALPLHQSFPYQLVQLLRGKGIHMHAPEVVAKTGWTSFELAEHLLHQVLEDHYDFVTLLVGVNNQYRGLEVSDCASDTEFLIKKALHLVGNRPERVVVLSIPDWGVTPYAANRNHAHIASAIDAFNQAQHELALKHGLHYIDITTHSRQTGADGSWLAPDELHYAAKTYAHWADLLTQTIAPLCQ